MQDFHIKLIPHPENGGIEIPAQTFIGVDGEPIIMLAGWLGMFPPGAYDVWGEVKDGRLFGYEAHDARAQASQTKMRMGYFYLGRVVLEDKILSEPILQFFSFDHLPEHLQAVSRPFGDLAQTMVDILPSNPESAVMLRKLLEAKDCAVRALLWKEPKP